MTVIDPPGRSRGGLVATVPGTYEPLAPESVPLTGVRIDVEVHGLASAVTVSQRYVNRERVPVEAVYSFPLEEQAAIFGFEALVGDQRVVGQVMEKERAFDEYDQAMAEGNGAYLLDQDRPNLFTASVGNLLPGQQAVITVRYVAKLERLGDQVRLKIPTTVAPRYIPEEQLRQMDPSEFDHLNPPTVPGGVPYGLELTIDFQGWSRVEAVECPSHPVRVSTRGKKATVELSGADVQLDQDVVVTFTLAKGLGSSLSIARDDRGDGILMLDLLPLREAERAPVEAIFLIDRSGSMTGSSIAQARDALLLALSSLQEGDSFNVVGFGSRVDQLFPRSVPYDDAALDKARAAVQGWDADLGGTEILTPLRQILQAPAAELPRRLLVLTDGEVSNETDCLELTAAHPETTVFAIGVGYGASDHLVRGLARAGHGQAEFVHPGERIEAGLMRQMARMTSAGLLEPHIDWGGLEPDLVAPLDLPTLYPGTPLTVFARVPGLAAATGPASQTSMDDPSAVEVTVTASGPDGEVRTAVAAELADVGSGEAIPRLFAREAIRDLEEGRAAAGVRGSQQRDRREARVKESVIELSTRYTLMSSYTSFVAVEEREGEAAADLPPAELRRIPVGLLKDWHGGMRGAVAARGMRHLNRCSTPAGFERLLARDASVAPAPVGDISPAPLSHGDLEYAGRQYCKHEPEEVFDCTADDASVYAGPSLVALISSQRANGSWELRGDTFAACGVSDGLLTALQTALRDTGRDSRDVASTALAVWLLRRLFPDEREQWQAAATKAETWLATHVTGGDLDAVWDAVDAAMTGWSPWGSTY